MTLRFSLPSAIIFVLAALTAATTPVATYVSALNSAGCDSAIASPLSQSSTFFITNMGQDVWTTPVENQTGQSSDVFTLPRLSGTKIARNAADGFTVFGGTNLGDNLEKSVVGILQSNKILQAFNLFGGEISGTEYNYNYPVQSVVMSGDFGYAFIAGAFIQIPTKSDNIQARRMTTPDGYFPVVTSATEVSSGTLAIVGLTYKTRTEAQSGTDPVKSFFAQIDISNLDSPSVNFQYEFDPTELTFNDISFGGNFYAITATATKSGSPEPRENVLIFNNGANKTQAFKTPERFGLASNGTNGVFISSTERIMLYKAYGAAPSLIKAIVSNSNNVFSISPGSIYQATDGSIFVAGCLTEQIFQQQSWPQLLRLDSSLELSSSSPTQAYFTMDSMPISMPSFDFQLPITAVTVLVMGQVEAQEFTPKLTQLHLTSTSGVKMVDNNGTIPTVGKPINVQSSASTQFGVMVESNSFSPSTGLMIEAAPNPLGFTFEQNLISGSLSGQQSWTAVNLMSSELENKVTLRTAVYMESQSNPAVSAKIYSIENAPKEASDRITLHQTLAMNTLFYQTFQGSIIAGLTFANGDPIWTVQYDFGSQNASLSDSSPQIRAFVPPYSLDTLIIGSFNGVYGVYPQGGALQGQPWQTNLGCDTMAFNSNQFDLYCLDGTFILGINIQNGASTFAKILHLLGFGIKPQSGLQAANGNLTVLYKNIQSPNIYLVQFETATSDLKSVVYATEVQFASAAVLGNIEFFEISSNGEFGVSAVTGTGWISFVTFNDKGVVQKNIRVDITDAVGGYYNRSSDTFYAVGKTTLRIFDSDFGGDQIITYQIEGHTFQFESAGAIYANNIVLAASGDFSDDGTVGQPFLMLVLGPSGQITDDTIVGVTTSVAKTTKAAPPTYPQSQSVLSSVSFQTTDIGEKKIGTSNPVGVTLVQTQLKAGSSGSSGSNGGSSGSSSSSGGSSGSSGSGTHGGSSGGSSGSGTNGGSSSGSSGSGTNGGSSGGSSGSGTHGGNTGGSGTHGTSGQKPPQSQPESALSIMASLIAFCLSFTLLF
mmetsp:Transcript_57555/g.65664  ORF Transcript_57555/g.65664 Transcript_57555/m.65664 type:complete len:1051 (+) Transcript_57555:27-3179(+)